MSQTTSQPMRIAAGRWFRHTFVRENLVSAIKTFAWLGPLTLLIWVYAERAQVVQVEEVAFPIDVRIDDPNRFVQISGFEGNVIATLNGPRSRIEAVRQDVRPDGMKPRVILNIDPKLPLGPNLLDAITVINQNEPFRYSGVNVIELRPQQLNVFVDTFEERELDVQVPASVTNLAPTPSFVPAKVRVRAPAHYFESAGTVTVEADLVSSGLLSKPGEHPASPRVYSPQLANYAGVTYSPGSVETTLNVRALNTEYVIPSQPVYLSIPPGSFKTQFNVTWPETIVNVKVSGPPDLIAQIEQGSITPRARLTVTGADAPSPDATSRTVERDVQIDLPEGVTVIEPPDKISFRVERVAP